MFKHDIIVWNDKETYVFHFITEKARLLRHSGGTSEIEYTEEMAISMYKIARSNDVDVGVYGSDEMTREAVAFNARAQVMDNALKVFLEEASNYFTPLLDAAYERRDWDEMKKIAASFPNNMEVEKMFVYDRIRQGEKHYG